MSFCLRKVRHKILIAAIITMPSFVSASDNIQIESKIMFNTSCARCHEGECSGRLSFHLPQSAADQHILRHAGELPVKAIRQLFELLRYMKEECSFYPFSFALIKDRIWSGDTLANFRSQSNKAYFIPLGHLEPGLYQLRYEGLTDTGNSCIDIINSEFDFADKTNINGETEQQSLQFNVDEPSEYYLRIRANKPVSIKRIELAPTH